MASWNSIPMEIIYQVLGWTSIICWALAAYPQIILNFRRKSVVGMSFDYVMLNFTKQSSYLIYNASLFFSATVQRQYFQKYGYDQRKERGVGWRRIWGSVGSNDHLFSNENTSLISIAKYDGCLEKELRIWGVLEATIIWYSIVVFFEEEGRVSAALSPDREEFT